MFISFINIKIRELGIIRHIVFLTLFCIAFFLSCMDIINANFTNIDKIGFWEILVYIFNETSVICYYFLFGIIILGSDIYNANKSRFHDNLILYVGNKKKWTAYQFLLALLISIYIVLATIIILLISYLVISKYPNFSNTWVVENELTFRTTPINASITSALFILLRIFLLCLVVLCINFKSKNYPMGVLGAIAITLYDNFFYDTFGISEPLNITLLEHTRIVYTEAMAPNISHESKTNIFFSLLVFVILIIIILSVGFKIIEKKDFMINDIKDDEN